jgi:cytoskeletal protein RodZ
MKTVGEILKKARFEKKIALDEVEKILKIRKKFLEALEENKWSNLPSLPYIKGFLRNYSDFLELNSDEVVAIFRRQYPTNKQKSEVLPKGLSHPLNEPFLRLTPQIAVIGTIFLFLTIFFGYLAFQYNTYISPPSLVVETPQEGEIVNSDKLRILGKAQSDAVLSINGEKIVVESNGNFDTTVSLLPGINTISIEATSKYGKKKNITRTIQLQENK